jgi:hypothetical protein
MGTIQTESEINTTTKTSGLPITCARGHQIYATYFPVLNRYGFACGLCHELGTAVTKGNDVLVMRDAEDSYGDSKKDDLLLYMETKAVHLCCPKSHPLMIFQLRAKGYALGCIHCKCYSKEIEDKGKILSVFVLRTLGTEAGKVPSAIIH